MPDYHISDHFPYKSYTNTAKIAITSAITGYVVEFPAFLTDFSQTFDATWNSENVFGRMDPIATYQGTKRSISLGIDIPAGSLEEAQDNLKRCASLTTMVYPAYNNGILSKSPLVRIKFANLIVGKVTTVDPGAAKTAELSPADVAGARLASTVGNVLGIGAFRTEFEAAEVQGDATSLKRGGLLGWIGGLSWKPNLEAGMFAMSGQFFPKVISMSFQFNVLHEETISQPTMADQNWPFGDDV
jgi:hypothetical protein